MALTWRPLVAFAAVLIATTLSGMASADSGSPIEVDLMFSTFLQNLRELILNIPNAVKEFFNRLTHPVRTIDGLIDFFRPDHFIKLPFRHLRCTCDNQRSCMCCLNATIPLFNMSEHFCQNLTFFPGNISTALNILSNNRSLVRTVLSGMHPPPLCLPFPPQFPVSALCARLHDLGFEDDGFRICPSNEIQLFHWKLFVLNFECLRIGPNGIKFGYRRHRNETRTSDRRHRTRPSPTSTNRPFGSGDNPSPPP